MTIRAEQLAIDFLRKGVATAPLDDLTPGEVQGVAGHINKDRAAVGLVRRWKDGTYHYEVARLRRPSPKRPWALEAVGGSSFGDGLDALSASMDEAAPPVLVPHHVSVVEERAPVVHELMGSVAHSVHHVLITTDSDSAALTLPSVASRAVRFFVAVLRAASTVSLVNVTVTSTDGQQRSLEVGGRSPLRSRLAE